MAASASDKFQLISASGTVPNVPRVTATRSAAGTSLTVDNCNWDTTTGKIFSTYQVNTSGDVVAGTQTIWKGVVNSSTSIGSLTRLAGASDTGNAIGDYVEIIPDSEWVNNLISGVLAQHNQDGTHSDITADSIEATTATFDSVTINGTASAEGWSPLGDTPDTITANGNRSYDLVFNSNDLTDTLSPGMRLKLTRTVTAPTHCVDLESSSSQYFNKTSPAGMTFTDDFVVSAWVKLESYTGANQGIISRYNGTSGWRLVIQPSGQVELTGFNAGSGNNSGITSATSVPIGRWVHIAAQLDMSAFTATTTTSYVMIDGINVPAAVSRAGTNPTALVQAGNLEIGSYNSGTSPFDGKIAQVAIYSAKVTQANVLATMAQGLTGSETSLISAYSFNNTLNDLSANANNLTAQNSAVATATDSPFAGGSAGTTEYGIVTAAAFSTDTTLTVQVPEGYALPTTGGISAVSYSINKIPYGFPIQADKWSLKMIQSSTDRTTTSTTFATLTDSIVLPVGAWKFKYRVLLQVTVNSTNNRIATLTLSSDGSTETDLELTTETGFQPVAATVNNEVVVYAEKNISASAATTYTALGKVNGAGGTLTLANSARGFIITADCNYL